ncbi:hypothetical protein Tco_0990881 [Tanacetum coccineum]|uniref:Uncharacterized protein n=1 Tax=Tanacetum coccineum TaxID=301880 RepID=A0ABQ5EZD7_9ASTR
MIFGVKGSLDSRLRGDVLIGVDDDCEEDEGEEIGEGVVGVIAYGYKVIKDWWGVVKEFIGTFVVENRCWQSVNKRCMSKSCVPEMRSVDARKRGCPVLFEAAHGIPRLDRDRSWHPETLAKIVQYQQGCFQGPALGYRPLDRDLQCGEDQGSRSLARLRDERRQSSATQEYPSLIDTFFVAHTVNEEFTQDEDLLIYVRGDEEAGGYGHLH